MNASSVAKLCIDVWKVKLLVKVRFKTFRTVMYYFFLEKYHYNSLFCWKCIRITYPSNNDVIYGPELENPVLTFGLTILYEKLTTLEFISTKEEHSFIFGG